MNNGKQFASRVKSTSQKLYFLAIVLPVSLVKEVFITKGDNKAIAILTSFIYITCEAFVIVAILYLLGLVVI